jgi:formylglycine-generating enzyme required for sulfatase activity
LDGQGRYTHYPRAILWLVRGGSITIDGRTRAVEPFYLSKLPLTNIQFEAFDPSFERYEHGADDDDTAVGIDFEQARGYCDWYGRVARKPIRLPTDVEWEYACRAETTSKDAAGPVWHAGNSTGSVPPLRRTRPNPFGLQSMLGGVWEWTASGNQRGGSYRTPLEKIGYDSQRVCDPGRRENDVGFRIARSLK